MPDSLFPAPTARADTLRARELLLAAGQMLAAQHDAVLSDCATRLRFMRIELADRARFFDRPPEVDHAREV